MKIIKLTVMSLPYPRYLAVDYRQADSISQISARFWTNCEITISAYVHLSRLLNCKHVTVLVLINVLALENTNFRMTSCPVGVIKAI